MAKLIHPGKESMGIVMTTVLGIGGSPPATFGCKAVGWHEPGHAAGFFGALVGAIAILAVRGLIRKKSA